MSNFSENTKKILLSLDRFKPSKSKRLTKRLKQLFEDFFVHKTTKNDRLIVYFGGHGDTYAGKIGYICPVNASKTKITSGGISMTNIKDYNDIIPAKHIFGTHWVERVRKVIIIR